MTKFFNWLLQVEHDVETILSDFTNYVRRLEARAEQQLEKVVHFDNVIAEADTLRTAALAEADKATNAAKKIKEIFV